MRSRLAGFTPQNLAMTAWAYAAADHYHQALLVDCSRVISDSLARDPSRWSEEGRVQLHQWQLWLSLERGADGQQHLLSESQRKLCRDAMVATIARPSGLQRSVADALAAVQHGFRSRLAGAIPDSPGGEGLKKLRGRESSILPSAASLLLGSPISDLLARTRPWGQASSRRLAHDNAERAPKARRGGMEIVVWVLGVDSRVHQITRCSLRQSTRPRSSHGYDSSQSGSSPPGCVRTAFPRSHARATRWTCGGAKRTAEAQHGAAPRAEANSGRSHRLLSSQAMPHRFHCASASCLAKSIRTTKFRLTRHFAERGRNSTRARLGS